MADYPVNPWQQEAIILHTQRLLHSYQHWLGKPLLEIEGTPEALAEALFFAPFVVVSHGMEDNPIFNYGNRKALELWQVEWEQLTQMPSRNTAEFVVQSERDRILDQAKTQGYITHYRGIRKSSRGERFWIEDCTIWNVFDEQQQPLGQAATYHHWTPIEDDAAFDDESED